jgi:hypothetical protein
MIDSDPSHFGVYPRNMPLEFFLHRRASPGFDEALAFLHRRASPGFDEALATMWSRLSSRQPIYYIAPNEISDGPAPGAQPAPIFLSTRRNYGTIADAGIQPGCVITVSGELFGAPTQMYFDF